jgi:hypothetical protein
MVVVIDIYVFILHLLHILQKIDKDIIIILYLYIISIFII